MFTLKEKWFLILALVISNSFIGGVGNDEVTGGFRWNLLGYCFSLRMQGIRNFALLFKIFSDISLNYRHSFHY